MKKVLAAMAMVATIGSMALAAETTKTPLAIAESSGKPTMIEFTTGGCVACRKMEPTIKAMAAKYSKTANILTVDLGNDEATALKYRIVSVPVQVFLDRNGKLKHGAAIDLARPADHSPDHAVLEPMRIAHEHNGLARRRLGEITDVKDDWADVARKFFLVAQRRHPCAAVLGTPREIVADEQRNMAALRIGHLPRARIRMIERHGDRGEC